MLEGSYRNTTTPPPRCAVALVTNELSGGLATMTHFLARVLRGSGRYTAEIVHLAMGARDRHSSQVVSPSSWNRGETIEASVWRGIRCHTVGARFSEIEFQRYRPRPRLRALLESYDLIQVVSGSAALGQAAVPSCKPVCIWAATTFRADRESALREQRLPLRLWSRLNQQVIERYERLAARRAARLLALSPYAVAEVGRLSQRQDVVLAPCGIDGNVFRPAEGGNRENYILYVGRLDDPRKNVALLLDAYRALVKENESVLPLWLVGTEKNDGIQKRIERIGLAQHVRVCGPKSGDDLAEHYRNASFLVLPSNEEGLGIVLLEAMASGKPVISTASGGPEAIVENGVDGFITPRQDVMGLRRAMLQLMTDSELRRSMGVAGRRSVERHYTIDAAGAVFLRVYDSIFLDAAKASARAEPTPNY